MRPTLLHQVPPPLLPLLHQAAEAVVAVAVVGVKVVPASTNKTEYVMLIAIQRVRLPTCTA